MKKNTLISTAGRNPKKNNGFVNPPVYRGSTILSATLEEYKNKREKRWEIGNYTYGRQGTPTHDSFEIAISALTGGDRSVAMSSGVAAINAALLAFLKSGDHVLMVDTVYGPTRKFCDNFLARFGVETTYYDPLIGKQISELIKKNTKVVYTESPGSLTFEIQDIKEITDAAHKRGCVVIIDDTWSSGIFFQPLQHGVDVSVIAATKYIVGHSDVMMGVITTSHKHWKKVRESAATIGANSGPDDVFLALRGLRTINLRMQQHYENGMQLAKWLSQRPEVVTVMHPALPSHPNHGIWLRDFSGASGLFGIELLNSYTEVSIANMLDGLTFFGMGASWGGFESLVLLTNPKKNRVATTQRWSNAGPILRLHAGLEDPEDLIDDLERGFQRLNAG